MRTRALPIVGVLCAAGLVLSTPVAAGAPLAPQGSETAARVTAVPLSPCVDPDNGDPELTGLSVLTPQVSTAAGDARVQVRVTVADQGGPGAPSGVDRITVIASKPDSGQNPQAELSQAPDGSWVGGLLVRRGARPGEDWTIHYLDMYDRAGNYRQYLSDDFSAAGYQTGFAVTGPLDRRNPSLESLRLSTLTPDVRRRTRTVRVRAVASDDLQVRRLRLLARDPARGRVVDAWLTRTAGTAQHGTWTGALRFPRYAQAGRWNLEAWVTDNVGRLRRLSTGRLKAAGFPAHLTVSSRTDDQPPTVRRTRITPRIDVRQAPGRVTVRVRATDERSGVARMRVYLVSPPESFAADRLPTGVARRVSGSRRDGVWRARVRVEDCTSWPGDWAVSVWTWDRVGRRTIGGRGSVRIVANDNFFNFPMTPERPVPVTGPATVRFAEDVTGISAATVPVLPAGYSRSGAAEPPPAVPGSWSCTAASGAAVACEDGAVRAATFTPSAPLLPGAEYEMWPNPEHVWAVTDLAGNPARGTWRFSTAP